jgi:hypothetical protein
VTTFLDAHEIVAMMVPGTVIPGHCRARTVWGMGGVTGRWIVHHDDPATVAGACGGQWRGRRR